MGGQKINSRLTFTIIVQLLILLIIGIIAGFGMNRVSNVVGELNQTVDTQADLGNITSLLNEKLTGTVNGVARGTKTWEEGINGLPGIKAEFDKDWQELLSTLSPADKGRFEST
ncbi:MAG: hypothetical protein WBE39_11780 [Candidatus Competibacter sp.]